MNFCSQCGFKLESNANYCINCGHQLPQVKQNQNNYIFEDNSKDFKKIKKHLWLARISFALTIIQVFYITYCLSLHQIILLLFARYYISYGIPLAIIPFILGLSSYKTCKSKLALVSIIINSITIIFYLCLLLI